MSEDQVQVAQPLGLPMIYCNGLHINLTNSDVSIIMLCNGQPTMVTNISFTTAKTLHIALGEVIGSLEDATSRQIMTMQEIGKGLEKIAFEKSSIAGSPADG